MRADPPAIRLEPAPLLTLTGQVDCASPAFWDGGALRVFTSAQHPSVAHGLALETLGPAAPVRLRGADMRWWIEAVHHGPGGRVWALYHLEQYLLLDPARPWLTVPRIGIAHSDDRGDSWTDLGIVMADEGVPEAGGNSVNTYFPGGVGDPGWAIDAAGGYAYILYSAYTGAVAHQGIGIARLALADLDAPVGRVWRWDGAGWGAPGLGGIGVPVLPARADWHGPGSDAFWGPSVHWNTHLGRFVVLLNRCAGPDWRQEGAYAVAIGDIADPGSWSAPCRVLAGGGWYVQVFGAAAIAGTDARAGAAARLFVHGRSEWVIHFDGPAG